MDRHVPLLPEKTPGNLRSALEHARSTLRLEAGLRAYGPFLLTLKLFVIVVLLGVLPRLGGVFHALALMVFAIALGATLWRGAGQGRGPSDAELRRRVEKASALPHRPLEALADKAAVAPALWESHRARMAALVAASRLTWPKLSWRQLDHPWLRLGTLALLLLALVTAQDQALPRLRQAVKPDLSAVLPAPVLDAWVTPPDYTGEPPIALRAGLPEIMVPEGSTLSLRVSGGWFAPVVQAGGAAYRLKEEEQHSYTLSLPLTQSGEVSIRQDGQSLGRWKLRLLVDGAPQLAFTTPPTANAQGVLRLDYTASDDLGLAEVKAVIVPSDISSDMKSEPLALTLPLSTPPPKEAHGFRFFDLTAHPWAGRSVLITLQARDSKGQLGESAPVSFRLPERSFSNPIAKAVTLMRRQLVSDGLKARMPVMSSILDLAVEVQHDRRGDLLGYMALNTIGSRLLYNGKASVIADVLPLMWDTALHFEDGGAGSALSRLREAQQALEDALNRGASPEELQELMNRLEQAISSYVEDLANNARNQPPEGDPPQQTINRQDLQNYLDQMRNLAQSGARDQARQMLQRLSQIMENLRPQGESTTGDPQTDATLRQLGQITRDQQQLMERTFRTTPEGEQQGQPQSGEGHQQGGPSAPGQGSQSQSVDPNSGQEGQSSGAQGALPQSRGLPTASEQESLRQRLEDVRRGLGENGEASGLLGQSGRAMQGAREGLAQGDAKAAMGPQGEALNHLQNAMRQLRERAEAGRMQGTDPFGNRPNGHSGSDTSRIQIPDAAEAARLKNLLDELRNRAGDMSRPQSERDYLERLLKWF